MTETARTPGRDRHLGEGAREDPGHASSRAGIADAGLLLALCCWGVVVGAQASRPGELPVERCLQPRIERQAGAERVAEVRCGESGAQANSLSGAERLLFGLPLELNRADARSLEYLPGIGPVRAEGIRRLRCEGALERLEDLARVHGIGHRTIQRLRGWAVPGPPPECR